MVRRRSGDLACDRQEPLRCMDEARATPGACQECLPASPPLLGAWCASMIPC